MTGLESLEERLREFAPGICIESLERLGGGACQENYRVCFVDRGVSRVCALRADARSRLPGSLRRSDEYRVAAKAVEAGVLTPGVRWLVQDYPRKGASAYAMDWAEGLALGTKVVRSAEFAGLRQSLGQTLGRELAKIHSVDAGDVLEPVSDAAVAALKNVEAMAGSADSLMARPATALVLCWLRENRPRRGVVVLVHGDFRVGNFMVRPDALSAVLDWEFAHLGAREEDLAWIAVRDWRFGVHEKPIGGFGTRAEFYEAYESASGVTLDPVAVHWWEVMGNLRWALACVFQGQRYADTRDIEMVAIGKRVAEMEWEALRLIEQGPTAVSG